MPVRNIRTFATNFCRQAIVFCRYHKRDMTGNRSHIYRASKMCKTVLGLDAVALCKSYFLGKGERDQDTFVIILQLSLNIIVVCIYKHSLLV